MSDIRLEKAHNFDFATARTKAKEWLAEANERFGLDVQYQEGETADTATISKAGVNAKAVLDAQKVVFEAELAFLAKPLKTPITNGIQQGLDKYFA
ncbi:polyhydroxyalkanoic acid system family protein [Moraxella oblonga]|uniref:polyhydroxyalkanoic acid system family protein n=1 Tax=Moraxella oblonga TaxID=200413 RepID=UPI00082C336D|nr:polyhydroxyalkanoic acid system family protein [Moraxella oblonga]